MTKAELIEKVAKNEGISNVAAGFVLQCFTDYVTKTLEIEGKVKGSNRKKAC